MTPALPDESRLTEMLDVARLNALMATLGRRQRAETGDDLPPFAHHLYFWDAQPPDKLGRDGHPRVGQGLIPDMGLPRRMWAGGRMDFHHPVRLGVAAEKRSRRASVVEKRGRSGPLAFVTLEHEIWQDGRLCLTEAQDLVYREDPSPDAPAPRRQPAPTDADQSWPLAFDTTMLFRYSALTFNGHRIHYDLDYARQVEGYAGLVVHGPLLAQIAALAAQDVFGPLDRFAFRGVSPLMHDQAATLCRSDRAFWVQDADGNLVMTAEV